jgi:hypothetical protein
MFGRSEVRFVRCPKSIVTQYTTLIRRVPHVPRFPNSRRYTKTTRYKMLIREVNLIGKCYRKKATLEGANDET